MAFILGIKVDETTREAARKQAAGFLSTEGQFKIFTPNPEILVKAQKDEYFRNVLNYGDLNLCDGFGLWLAMKFSKQKIVNSKQSERIPGADFMLDICRLAAEQGRGLYLLGSGSEEVVRKTAENLHKQFPKLKIVGWDKGFEIKERQINNQSTNRLINQSTQLLINESDQQRIINDINAKIPSILFVAFGMGKQEKWIYENLPKLPSVKIAMGVGGAFDYISGTLPRAPLLMRKIGLEWVYRLVRQPSRFVRIFNATMKFIWILLKP